MVSNASQPVWWLFSNKLTGGILTSRRLFHLWTDLCHLFNGKRRFAIRLNKVLRLFLQTQTSFVLTAAAPELCRGREWVGGGHGPSGQSACGLSEAWECCGLGQGDDLSAQYSGKLRGASTWWCGRGGGLGPLHGRPDGATAQSDSARFLATGLEPAQWLPGSDEEKQTERLTVNEIRSSYTCGGHCEAFPTMTFVFCFCTSTFIWNTNISDGTQAGSSFKFVAHVLYLCSPYLWKQRPLVTFELQAVNDESFHWLGRGTRQLTEVWRQVTASNHKDYLRKKARGRQWVKSDSVTHIGKQSQLNPLNGWSDKTSNLKIVY